jgi:hypothetical protein
MKRNFLIACQRILLILTLILMIFGNTKTAHAQFNPKDSYYLWVGLMTPSVATPVCLGSTVKLEFYFTLVLRGYTIQAPPLSPPMQAEVNISAINKLGTVSPAKFVYAQIYVNHTHTDNFVYKAKKKGKEEVMIEVSSGKYKESIKLVFDIKPCQASIQFNQKQTIGYDIYQFTTTYSGSGTLKVNDDGDVSGNGTHRIAQEIPSWSAEGGTCTQTPAEGSSGLSFSGQFSEDENEVYMEAESLAVSSSVITCTDDEGNSGSMTFPSYTYSDCKIQLADFSFDAGTVDVPFDCPGEDPYSVPVTIIPRRPA